MRIKDLIIRSINGTGLFRHALHFVPAGVAVLRYHSVKDRPEDFNNSIGAGIIHPSVLFEKQMELLAKKYAPVSLDDILLFLQERKTLPRRAVAVTFDDGFIDNHEVAKPVLDRYGIGATFYVTVSSLESPHPPWYIRLRHAFFTTPQKVWRDRDSGLAIYLTDEHARNSALVAACRRCATLAGNMQDQAVSEIENLLDVASFAPDPGLMLTWKQVKELHSGGHIIGSHTLTHPNMAHVMDDNALQKEMTLSKAKIEENLGAPVIHFSYPSPMLEPHWSERTIDFCRRAGYMTATTCTSGKVGRADNPMAIKRIWVPYSMQEFEWYLDNTLLDRQM